MDAIVTLLRYEWIVLDQKKSGRNLPLITPYGRELSTDRSRFTQMAFLHGHPAAAAAHKLHCRQLVLAHMGCIRMRCTAKAAIGGIAARAA